MPDSAVNNSASNEGELLVWDGEGMPPSGDWTIVLWNTYAKNSVSCIVSIPTMVEEQADELRAQYLAWIYELGETRIKGKRVIDHLELRPGLSYWWMTSIAHKPNFYEAQHINTVIKCFAFESFLNKNKYPACIKLITKNKKIIDIFQEFCLNKKIAFTYEVIGDTLLSKCNKLSFKQLLPSTIKAILFLLLTSLINFLSFNRNEKKWKQNIKSTICCFDILIHLQSQSFYEGKFLSNYWTDFPRLLESLSLPTTWIHTYYSHQDIKSIKSAQSLVRLFNKPGNGSDFHVLIDSQLNMHTAIRAMFYYLRLTYISLRLSKIKVIFTPTKSNFDFWPLFESNWIDSLISPSAISNCISLSIYESALKILPRQSIGFYIQENQPWEMALLYAWKAAGHGRLIGVPHTTARFWDLRYFYDPRTYIRGSKNELPMPDTVAVNGTAALKAYLNGGYPKSHLFEVEALRYLHLLEDRSFQRKDTSIDAPLRVLICGDNIPLSNEKLMQILEDANRKMPCDVRYIFKRHKAYLFDLAKYQSLNLAISEEALSKLLNECDVVIVGNVTSAAMDAYYKGLVVATMLDGESFNASPLRGMGGVKYFTDASELIDIINGGQVCGQQHADLYFHLDKTLPRWVNLLNFASEADCHV